MAADVDTKGCNIDTKPFNGRAGSILVQLLLWKFYKMHVGSTFKEKTRDIHCLVGTHVYM